MSIPPSSNPPPPGGYYPAPPPPKSNNGGCLKAAGITCGVLLLLGVIGVFVIIGQVKKGMSDPHSFLGTTMAVAKTSQDGKAIQQAIVRYHDRYNKYPDTLTDLVPDVLPDGKILHNSLDSNPSPGHITWNYIKPMEGAPGMTPVLILPFTMPVPGNSQQPPLKMSSIITLDGHTLSNSPSGGNSTGSAPTFPSGSGSSQ